VKRRLIRIGIIVSVCVVVAIPAGILLNKWMGSSSDGTVHTGTPTGGTSAAKQAQTPVDVKTSYFTTLLPAGFVIKRQAETPNAGSALLQMAANTAGETDQQFATTVGTMPSEGLSGIGDYNLRKTQTDTYTSIALPNMPTGTVAFRTVSGPAAFTLFWPYGGRYAELSFSSDGGATLEALQSTYVQVLSQWAWL
jgi:hypothetical protein